MGAFACYEVTQQRDEGACISKTFFFFLCSVFGYNTMIFTTTNTRPVHQGNIICYKKFQDTGINNFRVGF